MLINYLDFVNGIASRFEGSLERIDYDLDRIDLRK